MNDIKAAFPVEPAKYAASQFSPEFPIIFTITPLWPFLLVQKARDNVMYPKTFKSKPLRMASSDTSSMFPAGMSPALMIINQKWNLLVAQKNGYIKRHWRIKY